MKRSNIFKKKGGNNNTGGVANQIYDGAAEFGKFMALIGLIFGVLIGLVMIGIGIYLLVSPSKYTVEVQGKVTKAACNAFNGTGKNSSGGVSCATEIEYEVAGEKKTVNITTSKSVIEGQTMQLVYDPLNPVDAQEKGMSRTVVAWILIGIAIFIILGSALNYYLVNTFKFAAAATGVGTGISMVTPNN